MTPRASKDDFKIPIIGVVSVIGFIGQSSIQKLRLDVRLDAGFLLEILKLLILDHPKSLYREFLLYLNRETSLLVYGDLSLPITVISLFCSFAYGITC